VECGHGNICENKGPGKNERRSPTKKNESRGKEDEDRRLGGERADQRTKKPTPHKGNHAKDKQKTQKTQWDGRLWGRKKKARRTSMMPTTFVAKARGDLRNQRYGPRGIDPIADGLGSFGADCG